MTEQTSEGVVDTGLPANPKAEPRPEDLDAQTAELLYRQIRQKLGLAVQVKDSVESLCSDVQAIFNRIQEHSPSAQRDLEKTATKDRILQRIFEAAGYTPPIDVEREAIGITDKRALNVEHRLDVLHSSMAEMCVADPEVFRQSMKNCYSAMKDIVLIVQPDEGSDGSFLPELVRKIRDRFANPYAMAPSPPRMVDRFAPPPSPKPSTPPRAGAYSAHPSAAEDTALSNFLGEYLDKTDLDAPAAFDILKVCLSLFARLAKKNKDYGNSALKPRRILAKSDTIEQIYVRMDDKLNRLIQGQAAGEDILFDLVGYWVILQIALSYQE